MNASVKTVDVELRLKKAHIKLLRHPQTCLYGGVILMGESSVIDDPKQCPTAYTDGYNKRYGRDFMDKLTDQELAGVVLHENLHVLMKHIPRHRDLMKEDSRLANMAMDYAVNDLIVDLSQRDATLIKLPDCGLYDPMFKDWSVRRIYEYLKEEQEGNGGGGNGGGGGGRGEPLDEHGEEYVEGMSEEEEKKFEDAITDAINQGGILAGKFGAKIPRTIKDIMAPPLNWYEILQEFWNTHTRGKDELTWRRFNKHRIADGHYLPSAINETIGEVVIAIDTSGSISATELSKVASRIVELCETVTPERIRVLWWDTKVHGEQLFDGNYENIKTMLKPMGGGGTRASCVSEYITKNNITADCLIVFTDGFVEDNVSWNISTPTMWLISANGHSDFRPPAGQVVKIND